MDIGKYVIAGTGTLVIGVLVNFQMEINNLSFLIGESRGVINNKLEPMVDKYDKRLSDLDIKANETLDQVKEFFINANRLVEKPEILFLAIASSLNEICPGFFETKNLSGLLESGKHSLENLTNAACETLSAIAKLLAAAASKTEGAFGGVYSALYLTKIKEIVSAFDRLVENLSKYDQFGFYFNQFVSSVNGLNAIIGRPNHPAGDPSEAPPPPTGNPVKSPEEKSNHPAGDPSEAPPPPASSSVKSPEEKSNHPAGDPSVERSAQITNEAPPASSSVKSLEEKPAPASKKTSILSKA
ncbi:MAG: hypothetical protein LBP36_02805 [Oscillospiraceae bacterium]|jgi:hypothetical protein|nr:hypothetical protein [Oscillospiraceae bacterium]